MSEGNVSFDLIEEEEESQFGAQTRTEGLYSLSLSIQIFRSMSFEVSHNST